MPYFIITYDIGEERVNLVRKTLKKYFTWVQNSVFEGEIGIGKLEKCIIELKKIIKEDVDSIYLYRFEVMNNCQKRVIGYEKEKTYNVI
jgi:CRISPR-associated protein Cas2